MEQMKMTREEMVVDLGSKRGWEDKWVLWFAELAEDSCVSDEAVLDAYICASAMPQMEEDTFLTYVLEEIVKCD